MNKGEVKNVSKYKDNDFSITFRAFDNGDGSGPHYYNMIIDYGNGGEHWGALTLVIRNETELAKLVKAVNKLYY